MKISFIIPAYNEEKYILPCLESILALEELGNFEIIVVDNDSSDRTAALVADKFPQVKLLSEKRRGPARARNAGAKMATGEYFAFIDADCRLPAFWLIRVEKVLARKKNAAVLNGPYKYYDDPKFLAKIFHFFSTLFFPLLTEIILRKILRVGGVAFGGNMFVPKTAFESVGGFDTRLNFYSEDVDFTNRLSKFGKIIFSPRMWVYSSARRLRAEGRLKSALIYAINGVWISLFKKVLVDRNNPIR